MPQRIVHIYREAFSGLARDNWWLAVVMLVNRCGTMVLPFLTLYLTEHLHFSIAQAGYVMGVYGIGCIAGAWLGGILTDKTGAGRVQFVSLLLHGIMFLILGQLHSLPAVMICIALQGLVGEAFRPANAAAVAYFAKEGSPTRAFSLNRLAINLGWSVGVSVGGILAGIGYQWLFIADGLTCISAAFVLLVAVKKVPIVSKASADGEHFDKKDSAYRDGRFMAFIAFVFLFACCFFQLFSTQPVYLKTVTGMSEGAIGILMGLNGLMIALIEMVLVKRLENKRGPHFYIALGVALCASSFLVLHLAKTSVPLVYLSIILITMGEILSMPFMNNFWVARSQGHNRGQYASLYTMAYSTAYVIGPALGLQLLGNYGYTVLWWCVVLLNLLVAGGFWYMWKQEQAQLKLT